MAIRRACTKCGATTDQARCPKHRAERRPNSRQRGYDKAWERTRAAYLSYFPGCEQPMCPAPATDVHHLDGLGPNGPRGHDFTNLEALCHSHHSQRTAREQRGGWNAR